MVVALAGGGGGAAAGAGRGWTVGLGTEHCAGDGALGLVLGSCIDELLPDVFEVSDEVIGTDPPAFSFPPISAVATFSTFCRLLSLSTIDGLLLFPEGKSDDGGKLVMLIAFESDESPNPLLSIACWKNPDSVPPTSERWDECKDPKEDTCNIFSKIEGWSKCQVTRRGKEEGFSEAAFDCNNVSRIRCCVISMANGKLGMQAEDFGGGSLVDRTGERKERQVVQQCKILIRRNQVATFGFGSPSAQTTPCQSDVIHSQISVSR